MKMEIHIIDVIFMLVKTVTVAPAPSKGCESPWSDVSIDALLQVQEILNICDELRFDIRTKHLLNMERVL